MPTLRDRVRETLSAREPDEREARSELAAVLARSGSKQRRRIWTLALPTPVFVAAAVLLYFVVWRGQPREPHVAIGVPRAPGVHLYLHVAGEPSDRAITLDLDSKGDL
jgi:hypothetical protein